MKYCPSCQTEYADETLQFCLQDGTRLKSAAGASPTAAYGTEPETVFAPARGGESGRFDPQKAATQNLPPNQFPPPTYLPPDSPPAKKSNTPLVVAVTMLGTVLLIGAVGALAWLYLKKDGTEIAGNTNGAPNKANQSFNDEPAKNSNAKKSPTPAKTNANANDNGAANGNANSTPPPPIDRAQVVSDVSDTIDNWRLQSEARSVDTYMNNYAETIDYYNKRGATRVYVRGDKARVFSKYDSIRFEITNLTVTSDASGETATALFDKEWEFENVQKTSKGKVRQELRLRKFSGKWRITSEKDLKVYYTE